MTDETGPTDPNQLARELEQTTIPLETIPVTHPVSSKAKKPKKKKQTKADRLLKAAEEVLDAVEIAKADANEAMTAYQDAVDALTGAMEKVEEAMQSLRDVREEYQGWYDNMNEGLQQSPTGQKLEELLNIDLEPSDPEIPTFEEIDFSEIEEAAQQILDADLPLGFGRD